MHAANPSREAGRRSRYAVAGLIIAIVGIGVAAAPAMAGSKWFKVGGFVPGADVINVTSSDPSCISVFNHSILVGNDGTVGAQLNSEPIICGGCPQGGVIITIRVENTTPRHFIAGCMICGDFPAIFSQATVPGCVANICTEPGGGDPTTAIDVTACLIVPPNDDCADAIDIGEGQLTWDNFGATTDDPSFSCSQANVWYRYTAAVDGTLEVTTCGGNFATSLGVKSACADFGGCGTLTCNNQSVAFRPIIAGASRLIEVGSILRTQAQTGGLLEVLFHPAPGPDADCAGGGPARVVPSAAGVQTFAGWAVAAAGDRLAAGSLNFANGNVATVFRREPAGWVEEASMSENPSDGFGMALALDGEHLLVGAPRDDVAAVDAGAAYVRRRLGTSWVAESALVPASPMFNARFGTSVALEGEVAAVGAPLADLGAVDAAGRVHVFRRTGTVWTEEAVIPNPAPGTMDEFGHALDLDGDRLVVGQSYNDEAHVYRYESGQWLLEDTLVPAPDPTNDFGFDVAIDGDRVIVGAPEDDDLGADAGAFYVFYRSGNQWIKQAKRFASDASDDDRFGAAVDLGNDLVLVGAANADVATGNVDSGLAYLFRRDDNGTPGVPADDLWPQIRRFEAPDAAPGDSLGEAAALSGDAALIGAPGDDHGPLGEGGSAYIFTGLVSPDCNGNESPDACDIATGAALDCNGNGVPDLCDVLLGASEDCDGNGIPDECEVAFAFAHVSNALSPIGDGAPQSVTLVAPPAALGDVTLVIDARADLAAPVEFLDVDVNGVPVGSVFTGSGSDCPGGYDVESLVVPAAMWSAAVGGGDAVITVTASAAVDPLPAGCTSFVAVEVTFAAAPVTDANGNGVVDACECPGDFDLDGMVGITDLLALLGAWGTGDPAFDIAPSPPDGVIDIQDLLALLAAWGVC